MSQEKIEVGNPDAVKSSIDVNQPKHYAFGEIECWDYIKDLLGESYVAYCRGNVVKYVHRYDHKHADIVDQIKDLKKARKYLDEMILDLEHHGQCEMALVPRDPTNTSGE